MMRVPRNKKKVVAAHTTPGGQKIISPAPRSHNVHVLARARTLFPKQLVGVLRSIGYGSDSVLLARLRTIPLAIAGGHSFAAIWDNLCDDSRLSVSELEALCIEALTELERDLLLEGLI